jgi:ferritin-like metal-binding protein YciE
MDLQSLKELFIEQLEDALDAEKQLVKAIPDMVDAAKTPELRSAFEEHLTQTKGQVGRLEQVFSVIGEPAKEGSCDAMEGLIKEAKSMIKADGQAAVLDAGLVAAAQKVEHYEMATYGTVRTWANELGFPEAAALLQQTLNEESMANEKLTRIAESLVNVRAA